MAPTKTLLLSAILMVQLVTAQPGPAKPADTARDFYAWYLHALAKDIDPLTKDLTGVKRFVASSILAEINRQSKSPEGLAADPFLHAQDFGEDWPDHIAVAERSATPTLATVLVTLDLPAKEPNKTESGPPQGSHRLEDHQSGTRL